MKLTPKIQNAINKAAELHLGQTRKGGGLPYIVHPFSVAFLVSEFTDDENIISACLLHDVLEDVAGYGYEDLRGDFGDRVAELVKSVSEEKDAGISREEEKATWRERKLAYIDELSRHDYDSLMVSAADKICNLLSMVELYKEKGNSIWSVFNAPDPIPENSLWFYGEVLKVIESGVGGEIAEEYQRVFTEAIEIFGYGNHQDTTG